MARDQARVVARRKSRHPALTAEQVAQLPPFHAAVLMLFAEGLSGSQIAAKLDTTLGTVYSTASTARLWLIRGRRTPAHRPVAPRQETAPEKAERGRAAIDHRIQRDIRAGERCPRCWLIVPCGCVRPESLVFNRLPVEVP